MASKMGAVSQRTKQGPVVLSAAGDRAHCVTYENGERIIPRSVGRQRFEQRRRTVKVRRPRQQGLLKQAEDV